METIYHTFYEKYLMPEIQKAWHQCQSLLNARLNALDPQYVYQYSIGKVKPKNDIEEMELKIYTANNKNIVKNAEKVAYENDDMRRLRQVIDALPAKIAAIDNFNSQLQNTIAEYEQRAINTIEVSYRAVLANSNISKNQYYKSFDRIAQRYSSELNPVVATACETSVKKVAAFINQKQQLIDKNNADKEKYNQMIQKLQKQYDAEFALQKIKEINRDVNSQMDNPSDIAQKEEKNYEFQNIMRDIDLLDKEVNERRNYEIQFGQIEI